MTLATRGPGSAGMVDEVLPSWTKGRAREALVDFVSRCTTEGSSDFLPVEQRIAVFDNDGTLWCEKPVPIQAAFLLEKIGQQVASDPSLRSRQPWKAVYEKDHQWLADVMVKHYRGDDSDLKEMGAGLLGAYAGSSVADFAAAAARFLRSSENPLLKRGNLKTVYAPMRELLQYLEDHGFANFIVSGGGRDFIRPVSYELYGIPPDRVVGTSVALEYREVDGKGDVFHTSSLELFDDGPAKVVQIWARIGVRPVLAAGNSNGDLQMLKLVKDGGGLALLVSHDDAERDIAYTAGTEDAMVVAADQGWLTVSVRDDWLRVFIS